MEWLVRAFFSAFSWLFVLMAQLLYVAVWTFFCIVYFTLYLILYGANLFINLLGAFVVNGLLGILLLVALGIAIYEFVYWVIFKIGIIEWCISTFWWMTGSTLITTYTIF